MRRETRGGPRLLVTDRHAAQLLERARVFLEGDRVVYVADDDELGRSYNIPHVNLAVLFLGQGSSLTQPAARKLAEEHVHVVFTGTGGTPVHMGSLSAYGSTAHFRALLPVYLDEGRSLLAAKSIMAERVERVGKIGGGLARRKKLRAFDEQSKALAAAGVKFSGDLDRATSVQQLLGFEGAYSKSLYAAFANAAEIKDFARAANEGEVAGDRVGRANALIDHGNYLCYGVAGAALWALGVPPHLSLFHGKTRAGGLVFDLADSFKDAFVLPLAFAHAKAGRPSADAEREFRADVLQAFDDRKALSLAIGTFESALKAAA